MSRPKGVVAEVLAFVGAKELEQPSGVRRHAVRFGQGLERERQRRRRARGPAAAAAPQLRQAGQRLEAAEVAGIAEAAIEGVHLVG